MVVWFVSTVVSVPPFVFQSVSFSRLAFCAVFSIADSSPLVYSYLIVVMLLFAIATLVQLFCIGCIIYITRKCLLTKLRRLKGISSNQASGRDDNTDRTGVSSSYKKSQLQLVKVFGAIVTASVLTLIPAVISPFSIPFLGVEPSPFYSVAYLSLLSKSVIHPILEAYMTHEIREVLAKFCPSCAAGCKPRHRKESSGVLSGGTDKVVLLSWLQVT